MSHKVKILDFERKAIRVGDAQQILEKYLDEGYTIAGVCEANGFVTYTLVKVIIEARCIPEMIHVRERRKAITAHGEAGLH